MSKTAAAVLMFTLFALAQGNSVLEPVRRGRLPYLSPSERRESRQSICFPDVADTCLEAFDNVEDFNVTTANATDYSALNKDIESFCTEECILPFLDFYRCNGLGELGDFLNELYCGQHNGTSCFVLLLNYTNALSQALFCNAYPNCSSSCADQLQDIATNFGCCAASAFNNSASFYSAFIYPEEFTACGVDIGERCTGVTGSPEVTNSSPEVITSSPEVTTDSSVVNRFGLGLLTFLVAVAAIINACLF